MAAARHLSGLTTSALQRYKALRGIIPLALFVCDAPVSPALFFRKDLV
jgi:hypothetical protein